MKISNLYTGFSRAPFCSPVAIKYTWEHTETSNSAKSLLILVVYSVVCIK